MNFPILSEKRSNPSVRYRNYYFTQKTAGKVSAMFRCSTVDCYASISLKVDRATQQIQRPIDVKNTNDNHIENCLAKEDAFFETKEFLNTVKKQLEMTTNQQKSVQQLYEEVRSTQISTFYSRR